MLAAFDEPPALELTLVAELVVAAAELVAGLALVELAAAGADDALELLLLPHPAIKAPAATTTVASTHNLVLIDPPVDAEVAVPRDCLSPHHSQAPGRRQCRVGLDSVPTVARPGRNPDICSSFSGVHTPTIRHKQDDSETNV
jgi:hypothetical protein